MMPQLPSKIAAIFKEIWTSRLSTRGGTVNLQRLKKACNPRVGEVRVSDLIDDSVIKGLSENDSWTKHFAVTSLNKVSPVDFADETFDTITGRTCPVSHIHVYRRISKR